MGFWPPAECLLFLASQKKHQYVLYLLCRVVPVQIYYSLARAPTQVTALYLLARLTNNALGYLAEASASRTCSVTRKYLNAMNGFLVSLVYYILLPETGVHGQPSFATSIALARGAPWRGAYSSPNGPLLPGLLMPPTGLHVVNTPTR